MIFRYNLDPEFAEKLVSFSKINQYVDRTEYKEKWDQWIQDNKEMVDIETRRLESLGYKGDVIQKIYKSARYYFRTKESSGEPKQRREYNSPDKEMINKIDLFLKKEMLDPEFTPRKSFEKLSDVPKKTFNNRYYLAKTK
jgi:hypothetical protein